MSKTTIPIIPGDGIGPEIADAASRVLDTRGCERAYEKQLARLAALGAGLSLLPLVWLERIAHLKVALKDRLANLSALEPEHLDGAYQAQRLRRAIRETIAPGSRQSHDLGWDASASEYADAVISRL